VHVRCTPKETSRIAGEEKGPSTGEWTEVAAKTGELTRAIVRYGLPSSTPKKARPVSIKFVQFTNAATKEPILVNVDHVRIAHQVPGHDRVKVSMDGAQAVDVEGDLRTIQAMLMGEV